MKLAILGSLPALVLGDYVPMLFQPLNSLCVVYTVIEQPIHISTCFSSSTVATFDEYTTTVSSATCVDTTITESITIHPVVTKTAKAEPTEYTTLTTDTYTTFCSEPTTFAYGAKTFTVTKPTTITVTDCPCTYSIPKCDYTEYTTITTDILTTVCPSPTVITQGKHTYTITEATTLTITDCPCTFTRTKHSSEYLTSTTSETTSPVVTLPSSLVPPPARTTDQVLPTETTAYYSPVLLSSSIEVPVESLSVSVEIQSSSVASPPVVPSSSVATPPVVPSSSATSTLNPVSTIEPSSASSTAPSSTVTASITEEPPPSSTSTASSTEEPTTSTIATVSGTEEPIPSSTLTASSTGEPTPTSTATVSNTEEPTPSSTLTASSTGEPTPSSTATASSTGEPTLSSTATVSSTEEPTLSTTATASSTIEPTPSSTATASCDSTVFAPGFAPVSIGDATLVSIPAPAVREESAFGFNGTSIGDIAYATYNPTDLPTDRIAYFQIPVTEMPGTFDCLNFGFFYHLDSGLCVQADATGSTYPRFSGSELSLQPCRSCSGLPAREQLFCDDRFVEDSYLPYHCMVFYGDTPPGEHFYSTVYGEGPTLSHATLSVPYDGCIFLLFPSDPEPSSTIEPVAPVTSSALALSTTLGGIP